MRKVENKDELLKLILNTPTEEEVKSWVEKGNEEIFVSYGKTIGFYTYNELMDVLGIDDTSTFYLNLLKNNYDINHTVAEVYSERTFNADIETLLKFFTRDYLAQANTNKLYKDFATIYNEKNRLLKSLNYSVECDESEGKKNLYRISKLNLWTLLTISGDVTERCSGFPDEFMQDILLSGTDDETDYSKLNEAIEKLCGIKLENMCSDNLVLTTAEIKKMLEQVRTHTVDKNENGILVDKISEILQIEESKRAKK